MKKEKENEFYVFLPLVIYMAIILIIGIVMFVIFLNEYHWNEIFPYILLAMLVLLPICMFIWGICTMACKITINEIGITRRLFGIKKRFIAWKEVKEIRIKNPIAGWIFISKKSLGNWGISRCRLSKATIYLMGSPKVIEMLKKYCPQKELLQNL